MPAGRILVTGGTGLTGSHLCERLVIEGHRVRTIVRSERDVTFLHELGVEVIRGDIVDSDTALRATADVETVFHLAALFRQEAVSRRAFWDVNVRGTENLLRGADRQGVRRFIHCSTVGVHGDIERPPANEDAPYRPGDHYQESKMEGEKVALAYMQESEMGVTIVRPSGIYGPRDSRLLKLFSAIQQGWFWMIGTGEVLYHLIYIDDLIDGLLLCGSKDGAAGRIYILAGREFVALHGLVSLIAEALGVGVSRRRVPVWPVYAAAHLCELVCIPFGLQPPLYRRRVDFFRKSRAFDISRAVRELGFSPRVDLRTGLRKTAEWYRDNGYL